MEERRREIPTDRQSKRVGVYRRQYGVDDSWLNLSTNLSTVPRQKPGKIEILSQQLRIAYAIIFQPPCRPLDLIAYHSFIHYGDLYSAPSRLLHSCQHLKKKSRNDLRDAWHAAHGQGGVSSFCELFVKLIVATVSDFS